jgi:citrate synthase
MTVTTVAARGTKPIRSDIASSTASTVTVFGQDLVGMLGKVNLGDFAFLEIFKRLPDERESVLFNALVVTLVEHGVTPSVLAARMTYLGAPESLQGAVASGILGLGNTFVGTIEGAAQICQDRLPARGADNVAEERLSDEQIDTLAAEIIAEFAAAKRPIPGLGHPVHKPVDPRAQKLFQLGRELGFDDSATRLLEALSRLASERSGKILPVNATGAIGALASTLGVPSHVARGLGVIARAIGLVGHLLEEKAEPMATTIWYRAEDEASAGQSANN